MNPFGLSPVLFWSALGVLAAAAVALHFLRIRSRRVPVATLLFWEQAAREQAPRVLWRRLARLGSLALILAVLVALLGSAREPAPAQVDHQLVLLDPAVLALPQARRHALEHLEDKRGTAAGTRRALALATHPLTLLATFADPPGSVARALRDAPDAEPGQPDWTAALAAASAILAGRSGARVELLYLDPEALPEGGRWPGLAVGCTPLPAPLWDDGVRIAGPVYDDRGLASVVVRAERRGRGGPERRLVVERSGGEPLTGPLSDTADRARLVVTGLAGGGVLRARLAGPPDACPGNDSVTVHLPVPPVVAVYARRPGTALRLALDSLAGVRTVTDPAVADLRIGPGPAKLPALEFLPPAPAAPIQPVTPTGHPFLEGLTFVGVRCGVVEGKEGVLARTATGPVVVHSRTRPRTLRVAMAPDLEPGGLGRSEDFPRLLARAVRLLAGAPTLADGWADTGWLTLHRGVADGSLPAGSEGRTVAVPLRHGRGEWPVGPVAAVAPLGRFGVEGGGPARARTPGATDPEPGPPDRGGSPLPGVLAFLALALLLVEWWALHRGRVA